MYVQPAPDGLFHQAWPFRNQPAACRCRPLRLGLSNLFQQGIRRTRYDVDDHSLYNVVISITRNSKRAWWLVLLAPLLCALLYFASVALRIARESSRDEARRADVIIVLGAAEYNGRPSPVLRARLDHAASLYAKGLAPMLMTTGGAGGDPQYTEGTVGRAYLIDRGIPAERILVESQGSTTVYSLAAAAEIMRTKGLHSCILVSDGYHIFRAKKLMQAQGISVYGSPRAAVVQSRPRRYWLYAKQAMAYALWRVGITV